MNITKYFYCLNKNQRIANIKKFNLTINISNNNDNRINIYLSQNSDVLYNVNDSVVLKNLTLFSNNFSLVEKEMVSMINATYCIKNVTLYDVNN